MLDLQTTRCFHHPAREAVARCPGCRRTFCRECIVDYASLALCADCMAQRSESIAAGRSRRRLFMALVALAGWFGLWFAFYAFGRLLLALPSSFHEGGIWTQPMPWIKP